MRRRCYCFTENLREGIPLSEAISEAEKIQRVLAEPSPLQYIIVQVEKGETTNRIHLQGYAEFGRPVGLHRVKKLFMQKTGEAFWNHVHLEPRMGSQAQAIAYCKKAETRLAGPYEYGKKKKEQRGTIFHDALNGATNKSLREKDPREYAIHRRALQILKSEGKGPRHHPMKVLIFVGASGTGKTTLAQNLYKDDCFTVMWPSGNGMWWWDGYEGQKCVILDEFVCQVKLDQFLRLLDRHPMKVQIKGASIEFSSTIIIITTNIPPEEWYGGVHPNRWDPLARRIKEFAEIYQFSALTPQEEVMEASDDDATDDFTTFKARINRRLVPLGARRANTGRHPPV